MFVNYESCQKQTQYTIMYRLSLTVAL